MKKLYETDDGKQFSNEEEAIKHQELLNELVPAEEYGKALAQAGWTAPALTRQVNAAKAYLTFKETGILPEAKAKKAEEFKPAK